MKGLPQNKPVVILLVLSVSLFVFNVGSCINLYGQSFLRKKEMLGRLDTEEKLMKLSQEKASLSEKLKAKEKELEEEWAAFEITKKTLLQEQLVCQTLKDELQKVTKLNEILETDLKEALKDSKKAKR
jgi:alpha-N-acetylglucosamine transferase